MKGVLFFLRLFFVITIASTAYQISLALFAAPPFSAVNIICIIIGALFAVFIIWIEIEYASRFINAIFTVILGILVGFIASTLLIQAIFLIPHIRMLKESFPPIKVQQTEDAIKVGITFFFCYLSIVVFFRTRNRYKMLIPFVELSRESSERYLVLDSSVIIDGRVLSICDTNVLPGTLVIPKFILNELQALADSSDRNKRIRGRRGIDILAELQKKPKIKIYFDPDTLEHIKEVDDRLIALSQRLNAILVTNDYNLKKIAELHNIEIINLNAVANALRPPVIHGDAINIQIVKKGEEINQGIGYLNDGTVVIVENGFSYLDKNIEVIVTNVLQSNMGRMVFARPANEKH